MAEHETDYQRARRQRSEVKQHGVTSATPAKSQALKKAKGDSKFESNRADYPSTAGGQKKYWSSKK